MSAIRRAQGRSWLAALSAAAALLVPARGEAQAEPRITALFPAAAKAGTTVEVAIRGAGLDGARELIVDGAGLSARLNAADVRVDPADQRVFQAKCSTCHETRGPASISRTAAQWVETVDRMIREQSAPIATADREKIVRYLEAAARAAGLTATVTVAADAPPGRRELRVLGANGASTAFPFQVTHDPEALEVEPNSAVGRAQPVQLPLALNGQLAERDVDFFRFTAKRGERLVFNCSAYRLNPGSQGFFFPVLSLYDAAGRELVRNTGYYSIDPLIDWTAPADGDYAVMVRDLLYRGSPATVYRLSLGPLPYDTYLFPAGGRAGETAHVEIGGKNLTPSTLPVPLPAGSPPGIRPVSTRWGTFPFVAGAFPEVIEAGDGVPQSVTLPASLNGRIGKPGEEDRFRFSVSREQLGPHAFEVFARRLGSPLAVRITLKDARGSVLQVRSSTPADPDPRLDYAFGEAGDYLLEIAGANSKAGPSAVYRVSAGPAPPDFQLAVSPDNPALGPGMSVYLEVAVQRRVGVTGDIELALPDLPPGVSAVSTRIGPKETQGFVVLTAAPDAKPGAFAIARVLGRSLVNGEALVREATPHEAARNSGVPNRERSNMVVAVGPPPEWTVRLEADRTELAPGAGPLTVTVRLRRSGGDREMPFGIVGVPDGIEAPRTVIVKKGADEATFTLTLKGTGNSSSGRPLPRDFLLAVVNGRAGQGTQQASPPLAISVRGDGPRTDGH